MWRFPKRPERAEGRLYTPSHLYNERYFLTDCEGHEGFGYDAEASVISPRLAAILGLIKFSPGERILDIGCGRGEVTRHCARGGAIAYGLDYSADALRIVQRGLATETDSLRKHVHLLRADAKRLPFAEASFDKLLMLDIVEHLYPWELVEALREAWRVLAFGGQLIIHTAPNRWYYQFGYPLYRMFERLRGRQLPHNPRSRFPFHYLHVNEQDILRLRRSLRRAGFESKVWLDSIQPLLPGEHSPVIRSVLRILLRLYPFRWIFRNDIFAIAYKWR